MKSLKDILYKVRLVDVMGSTDVEISSLCFDSRKAEKGSVFAAVRGSQVDGHKFIDQCIEKGAVAIVAEELPEFPKPDVCYIKVANSGTALGIMAENFYDNPSAQLKMVAVTGTNGKTTVATLLFRLFRELGYDAGLLSTVQNQINEEIIPSTHTTPDAIQLSALLRKMLDAGCTHCFMEASSHAIDQGRVSGLDLDGAIFTNLSHDHLDYHKTFQAYIEAKKLLFDNLSADAFALINTDDRRGPVMAQNTKAKVYSYGLKGVSDFKAKILENTFDGLVLNLDGQEVYSRLIGEFNAYNLLSIYGAAILLGEDKMEVLQALSKLPAAEGRFDYFISDREKVVSIVDYAHTPDALKQVLSSVRAIRTGNEQVITIIGCGGNRDKEKRPVMARIACELSNKVLLTSDNPRDEEPETIIRDMKEGVTPNLSNRVLVITDRREAIRTACTLAQKGDIILLAGKGHEKYQEIKGVKHPFDDKEILLETLKELDK